MPTRDELTSALSAAFDGIALQWNGTELVYWDGPVVADAVAVALRLGYGQEGTFGNALGRLLRTDDDTFVIGRRVRLATAVLHHYHTTGHVESVFDAAFPTPGLTPATAEERVAVDLITGGVDVDDPVFPELIDLVLDEAIDEYGGITGFRDTVQAILLTRD
jgi:hypothetical protein